MLGLPNTVVEQRNTRGNVPMDTFSNDWAVFVQDDWKIGSKVTTFLGLRYEVVGAFVDRNDIFANFITDRRRSSHRAERAKSPRCCRPARSRSDRTLTADQVGLPRP